MIGSWGAGDKSGSWNRWHGDAIKFAEDRYARYLATLPEESVRAHLPIDGHATAVTLMTQQSAGRQWIRAATFTLA